MTKIIYRLFPFIPLILGIGFIVWYVNFATPDAQDGILYMYILVLSLLGMLMFTVAGLVYLTVKRKELLYYKILYILLTVINLLTLLPLALFGLWVVAVVLAIMAIGFIALRKDKKMKLADELSNNYDTQQEESNI